MTHPWRPSKPRSSSTTRFSQPPTSCTVAVVMGNSTSPETLRAETRAASGVEKGSRPLQGHMPVLDGVRGLAVLMVLVFHFVGDIMEPTGRAESAIAKLVAYGATGVDLFFILSGFLITGILFEASSKRHYFRNFYMRRVLRIFPLYYGVLVCVFFVAPALPFCRGAALDFLIQRQAWAWLYAVNVYIAKTGTWSLTYIEHFWSLCVEEHFYLVWPFIVWLLARHPRRLMWVSLFLAVGAMVARLVGFAAGLSWTTTYVFTPFRLDGLALGGFLAILARQPRGLDAIARNVGRVGLAAGALFALSLVWVKVIHWGLSFVYPIRSSLIIVLLATLLMGALTSLENSVASRFFRSRFMLRAGTYSYGLYVYHHFIYYYMKTHRTWVVVSRWLGSNMAAVLAQAAVGMLASAAIAYASYELFEKPFLSLKRYFEARPVER